MNARRLIVILLRALAAIELLAFGAMVMPLPWMDSIHAALGLGEMPRGAAVEYLARSESFLYGMHGVLLWLLASDPDRYRRIIAFNGLFYLAGGLVLGVIGRSAGMPWSWWAAEAGSGVAVGGAILLLAARIGPWRNPRLPDGASGWPDSPEPDR